MVTSCKQDGLLLYNAEETGNNVYFSEKITKTDTAKLMKPITFGLSNILLRDTTIKILLSVTGTITDQNREAKVVAMANSTMVEGKHYEFVGAPIIPAGSLSGYVTLKFMRTEDLKDKAVSLNLSLEPNENFEINMPFKTNSNVTQDLLSYSLTVDDIFPIPYLWTSPSKKTLMVDYFGEFSNTKLDLIVSVLNVNRDLFYDQELGGLKVSQMVNWSSYMKYWLAKEKSEGRTHLDENNQEVLMGKNAK